MAPSADTRADSYRKITAGPGFNRWLIPPAALAIHMCIGQVYGTSVYQGRLAEHFSEDPLVGIFGQILGPIFGGEDAAQTAVAFFAFSLSIVLLGLSAALFGKWVDSRGPRMAMLASTVCWVSGFLVGSVGIFTQQLWLVGLGYGVIGGIGLGIGYIAPVSTLMKWFPDRPGLGTGMAIMGFGVGAMIAAPFSNMMMGIFDDMGADEGASVGYLFLTLAVVYGLMMLFAAWIVRVPPEGWKPEGFDPDTKKSSKMISAGNVTANNAVKTPQFWLLWVVLFVNITASIGLLPQAASFVQDFFREDDGETFAHPEVAAVAAAGFVGYLSLTNTLGRFIWASTSDKIGRKPIYMIYLGLGAALYVALGMFGNTNMAAFIILIGIILSFYGGGFATIPAYLRDLFGTVQVGAIHGRLLTCWSAAGIVGPAIVNITLDAADGVPGEDLTAADYRPALFIMAGLLVVGFIANLMVRPVSEKWHEESKPSEDDEDKDDAEEKAEAETQKKGSDTKVEPAGAPIVPVPVAWVVVSIPMLYGLVYTFINAIQLFFPPEPDEVDGDDAETEASGLLTAARLAAAAVRSVHSVIS
ncbi:OFA family MFS transporter [Nesterenkonia populi]|uniref:OFA family MFS transporter n=1 Tax=Nesterenkonia populi TaxID=1591087 RepID=UPI0011BE8841|nr:OFA family MFS transporter [Nesterenkonia populi]